MGVVGADGRRRRRACGGDAAGRRRGRGVATAAAAVAWPLGDAGGLLVGLNAAEGQWRAAAVVGEELAPRFGHRVGIGQVLGVHLVDEPGVRTEVGARPFRTDRVDRSHPV